MKAFNITNITKPINSITPYTGDIALTAAYFKPRWYKPQQKALFSWERTGNNVRNYISIENGKTYSFQNIVDLLKTHLGNAYQFLIFNNDRVSLKLNEADAIKKVMFCSELLNKYRLPILQNYITDTPVQGIEILDKNINITFNDTELLFFRCLELDNSINFENSSESDILALVPLKSSQIFDGYHYISHEFRNIVWKSLDNQKTNYELNFAATHEKGNILPFYEHAFVVLNK